MDKLVYEDNPYIGGRLQYWLFFRTELLPFGLLWAFTWIYLILFTELLDIEAQHPGVFLIVVIVMSVLCAFPIVEGKIPRKYQIFDSKIRIILGWPFSFTIPFNNIANARRATWTSLGWLSFSFISTYSSDNILHIVKRRGPDINITPSNRDLFLEHLNKAMDEWRRYNAR